MIGEHTYECWAKFFWIFYRDFLCNGSYFIFFFFFSSRRRHTRLVSDWSSDVCSSDLSVGTTTVHLDTSAGQADVSRCTVVVPTDSGVKRVGVIRRQLPTGTHAPDRKSVV